MVLEHVGFLSRLFYRHFHRQKHSETLFVWTTHSTRQHKAPEAPLVRPRPFGLIQFIKIPSGKHLETMAFGLHSLALITLKNTSREMQAQSSSRQLHQNSTANRSFLPPLSLQRLVNNTGSSPSPRPGTSADVLHVW